MNIRFRALVPVLFVVACGGGGGHHDTYQDYVNRVAAAGQQKCKEDPTADMCQAHDGTSTAQTQETSSAPASGPGKVILSNYACSGSPDYLVVLPNGDKLNGPANEADLEIAVDGLPATVCIAKGGECISNRATFTHLDQKIFVKSCHRLSTHAD